MSAMRKRFPSLSKTALLLTAWIGIAAAQNVDWHHYAADAASSKFVALDQIDADNFARLQVAWRYTAPDSLLSAERDLQYSHNKGTPLVVDGVMYYGSPLCVVSAVDAATGEELWTFDPEVWRVNDNGVYFRGVAYWEGDGAKRIFTYTYDSRLISLDAETGLPDPAFGDNGVIDLPRGLRRPADRRYYSMTSPPIVCRDVLVVGSVIRDWAWRQPPKYTNVGDVRGFDVRTGELLWTFHTIPQEGEYGHDTWGGDSAERFGSTNVWAVMSADEELGYVYLPVSTPSHDYYGGERPGDNLFGESLVCLNAETGARVWHFQIAHHGLWDYDLPAAPVLMDVETDGRTRKLVAQVTKQAFCFVFDRVTGEPVWPIKEKKAPESQIEGEQASPTQPFPTKPKAFDLQGLREDDLIDLTPELRQGALDIIGQYEYGPLYTPPSLKGTLLMPGLVGGADWSGATAHPGKGLLYIPSHTMASSAQLREPYTERPYSAYWAQVHTRVGGPQGLPLTKPPFGRITAVDMRTGEHRWMVPVGRGPVAHPALAGLDLPDLGWATRSFAVATETLLIVASEHSLMYGGDFDEGDEPYLYAFDLDTGAQVGQVELPAHAYGSIITYMVQGKQYVAVPIGDLDAPPRIVVLALP